MLHPVLVVDLEVGSGFVGLLDFAIVIEYVNPDYPYSPRWKSLFHLGLLFEGLRVEGLGPPFDCLIVENGFALFVIGLIVEFSFVVLDLVCERGVESAPFSQPCQRRRQTSPQRLGTWWQLTP